MDSVAGKKGWKKIGSAGPGMKRLPARLPKRDLKLLLEGLDIWNAHKAIAYTEVA